MYNQEMDIQIPLETIVDRYFRNRPERELKLFQTYHGFGQVSFSIDACEAIRDEDLDSLGAYLRDTEPAAARDSFGNSLLHVAARLGSAACLAYLLQLGCRVDAANCLGDTALIEAVRRRELGAVRVLLDYGADVTARNNDRDGPLHLCRSFLRPQERAIFAALVERLLARGASSARVAELLVEADCPLQCVAWTDNAELVRLVCDKAWHVDRRDGDGFTALHAAVYQCNHRMLECLLRLGADPRAKSADGLNVLHWLARWASGAGDAAAERYAATFELLLRAGADVNAFDSGGKTPLHEAASLGSCRTVGMFLGRGADPAARDFDDNGVLHYAAENPDVRVLKLFLGADALGINSRNMFGATPLHVAAEHLNYSCIQYLLSCGAELNIKDYSNVSPLCELIYSCGNMRWLGDENHTKEEKTVQLMLDAGVDMNKLNRARKTILSDALERKMEKVLLRHLAKLEKLGQPIGRRNLRFIEAHKDLQEYLQKCRRELENVHSDIRLG